MTYSGITKDQIFSIERKALENAQEEMVLSKFTAKKSQPQKSGNTLKLHYYDHMDEDDVHVLTEGTTPVAGTLTRVAVEGSLKRQGAVLTFTDELMEMHENAAEMHKEQGSALGYVLGRVLEKDMFAVGIAGAGTLVPFSGIDADLKLVRQALRTANAPKFTSIKDGSTKSGTVPINSGWYGFFSLADADLARAATDFISVEDYGYSDGIAPNEIGAIKSLGLRIVETDYLADGVALFLGEDGLGSLDLGGKNRIEYIVKELGSEGSVDALNQRGSSSVKSRSGSLVLMANRVVAMQTSAP